MTNNYKQNLIELCVSPLIAKSKKQHHFGSLVNSFSETNNRSLAIDQIADLAVNKLNPFVACAITGTSKKNENFKSAQLLMLDIDNSAQSRSKYGILTVQGCINRLKGYGLDCSFIYRTFSDVDGVGDCREATKFRVIWVLDECIHSLASYNDLIKYGVNTLFPEGDKLGAVQFFFGGQGLCYSNFDYKLKPEKLLEIASQFMVKDMSSPSAAARKIRNNKVIKNKSENPSSLEIKKALKQNLDLEILKKECGLVDDFLTCNSKIEHPQLFGLYLFFAQYKGGQQLWKEAILNNPFIDDCKVTEVVGYNNALNNYQESATVNYLPVGDKGLKYKFLSQSLWNAKHHAIIKDMNLTIDLKSADKQFKDWISNRVADKVNIFQLPTGFGKSEAMLNMDLTKTVIAFPTTNLMIEMSDRFRNKGVDVIIFPMLDDKLIPPINRVHFFKLRAVGLHTHASAYLKNLIKYPTKISGTQVQRSKCIKGIKNYFNNISRVANSELPILCTHRRLLFTRFDNHSNFIIDEDPFASLVQILTVNLKDIITLKNLIASKGFSQQALGLVAYLNLFIQLIIDNNGIFKLNENQLLSEEKIAIAHQLIRENIILFKSPISKIFDAKTFDCNNHSSDASAIKVSFAEYNQLKLKGTVTVLSATLNKFIANKIFDRPIFKSLLNIKEAGIKRQYSDRSFSKFQMLKDTYQPRIELLNKMANKQSIITYKNSQIRKLFEKDKLSSLYIESSQGSDILKGEKIMVIGTPNLGSNIYLLMADIIDIKWDTDNSIFEMTKIDDDFKTFSIMTFRSQELQKLHFYIIETYLVQACGRARTLREKDAEVSLFSNYPLRGFQQHSIKEFQLINRAC